MNAQQTFTSRPVKKLCPKCKQTDYTDFSKCRFCGTRYDFVAQAKGNDFSITGIGIATLIGAGLIFMYFNFYMYTKVENTYKNPTALVGRTLSCKTKDIYAAMDPRNLISYDISVAATYHGKDPNAPEIPSLPGGGMERGITSMVNATEEVAKMGAGQETEGTVTLRYVRDGRIAAFEYDQMRPLSVNIADADTSTPAHPVVKVKVLNGPHAGSFWWINPRDLAL